MTRSHIIRALVLAVLASALVYAVLITVGDGPAVARTLRDLDMWLVALVIGLSTASYLLRSARWGWLMRLAGHPVTLRDALYLHMSGQTMSISPGRLGEVLKPWLAAEVAGLPVGNGIALVFAERVADLIAVCILALGGLSLLGSSMWVLPAALLVIIGGTAIASSEWFHRLTLTMLSRRAWARRHAEALSSISDTTRTALSWRTLVLSVPVSAIAWGLEGVGFWLLIEDTGFREFGMLAAVSVFAVSTIIGAFTFMPGGIGVTEASLAGILLAAGMPAASASAITLIVRVATLWWAVLLGWVVFGSRPALLRRLFASSSVDDVVD